jgi:hypothetical protein
MKKFKHTKKIEVREGTKRSLWKNKKFLWILAFFIMIVMVFSVFTLMFSNKNSSKTIDYNGYKFTYTEKGWVTQINGQNVAFDVLPTDVQGIQSTKFGFGLGKTYVAFNPTEYSENTYEISRLLAFLAFSGRQTYPACITEIGCGDLPVVDCNKTGENIVYFRTGNSTEILQEGNCLVLQSKPGDETKVIALFVYQLLGIEK